jgi:phenylacetic acid degradation operon negative regulatory protein
VKPNVASELEHGPAVPGRSAQFVPFLFGVTQRPELSGPALVRLLGDLGVTPAAARGLLARLRSGGSLASRRDGRFLLYRLDGWMAVGFERIRTEPVPPVWEGHFHALVHHVPEEHRAYRDALRRAAMLRGFGVLTGGVLVSLRDRFDDLSPLLADAPAQARLFRCRIGMDTADAARAASHAWDVPDVLARQRARIAQLRADLAAGGLVEPRDGEALRRFTDVTSAALLDLLATPPLPLELRPPDWTADLLRATVDEVQEAWYPAVASYVNRVLQE